MLNTSNVLSVLRKLPWLYCIGSLLLFCSWLSEKHFEYEAKNRREDLDRLQVRMSSNHTIAQVWYSHIRLLDSQPERNFEATAMASLFYMEFTLNVLQSAVAWDNENMSERNQFAEFRENRLESAKAAYREKDYDKVISHAAQLRALELQSAGVLVPRNYKRYNELEDEERRWNSRLRIFYVFGALLVGVAFVRERSVKASSEI
ncbi:MAG: hypothetical protein PSV26_21645 [Polaromonas sp.]|uniref:hypothetical protein n=1 Tax=Polaromonas sp. TaxID=1869339 RepID=UPI002489754F|nr:hypothetical protein [Polaromonas sp.]MDI1240094.1 hypothetical protein [Polaromonas sp.]